MRKINLTILFCAMALPVASFAVPATPGSDAEARPVNTAECDYDVGQAVKVQWKGKWYEAQILKTKADCSEYFIHYTGWSDSWDEWVTPDRIQK
ncbi:MAG: hypothetical protein KDK25_08370 [Leptospiraceae bacterium]|nr:hypothetical protein [Leptospiraceae bacterium]